MDPGAEARLSFEAVQRLIGLDEGLLGRLVRLVMAAQDAPRHVIDVATMPGDQQREGALVTGPEGTPAAKYLLAERLLTFMISEVSVVL